MATTTPNFGWSVPTSSDLVKNGATAIETLGDAIDASLVDLKGGTTGQVLAKASGTDMDFTWTTDASGISPTIFAAKGDLLGASANDTPAVLAVGNNGETLVADSSTSTGLRYQGNFAAGKNAIINGDFRTNQRNFTSNTANGAFNFDRFGQMNSGGTVTVTPQTFTPGTAPVAGYEAINFVRLATTGQSTTSHYSALNQKIEDVRTFANQTVTLSFWAKANSGTPYVWLEYQQQFGSGGSGAVVAQAGTTQTISTSWARYSVTFTLPSLSGKTIGTSSFLDIIIWTSMGSAIRGYSNATFQNNTIDIWGVQLEAGSVTTAFQTASGSIGGELALCQRYYQRIGGNSAYEGICPGIGATSNLTRYFVPLKVTMRVTPTSIETNALAAWDTATVVASTGATISSAECGPNFLSFYLSHSSGITQFRPYFLLANNSTSAYLGINAEL